MSALQGLQPEAVLKYFEEICAIPHGSHNTKQISDYCVAFAQEHLLTYIQDEYNNIIIYVNGTAGYEHAAPVMIQGHLDMVCEKTADCTIDFEKDGLQLEYKDGMISAKGTTLGGDDGIAIAYALAIADSGDIPHPPLELVFTVDEEVGMLGAAQLPFSELKSRIMLNLDSEDEGYLLVSCAGGSRINCMLPIARESRQGVPVTVTVGGLTGGHSGVEIIQGRANANMLLGRLLAELDVPYQLTAVNGGMKDNAIPREAQAKLLVAPENVAALTDAVKALEAVYAAENHATDAQLYLAVSTEQLAELEVMTGLDASRVITALRNLPNCVQRMSHSIEGLVQTSLNLGVLTTEQDKVTMTFSVRSSVASELEELVGRIQSLMDVLGGEIDRYGDYPAWEYKEDSPLRELMCRVFAEQYGHEPVVHAIHAGVECGLFAGALEGLDCVSFGPDLKDIHTTAERMDVASVQRTWEFLKQVLKELK